MREQKIEEYKDKFANPYVAAGYSWVDAVIHCDDNAKLAKLIVQQGRFDQLIIYPTFLHVSYKCTGANRHRVLRKTAKRKEK